MAKTRVTRSKSLSGGSNNTGKTSLVSAIDANGDEDRARKYAQFEQLYRDRTEKKIAKTRESLQKKQQAAEEKGDTKRAKKYADQITGLNDKQAAEEEYNAKELAAFKRALDNKANAESKQEQREAQAEIYKLQLENATALGSVYSANGKSLAANLGSALGSTLSDLSSSVEDYLDLYTKYMSSINARVQGARTKTATGSEDLDYEAMNDVIAKYTAANPYITYEDVLENLNELVEDGIADNVVQRAFLNTISDKIATTFDAAESSLLNIIRIQQADSTASRLGMEAELTQLFNSYFGDTSYLSNSFDTIQASLTDLSSQLDYQTSVEFEYMVQKWLGSLGSVGVSDSTLTSLAEGINALGTGDIDWLQSNTSVQNLLVMASNRAGLDYSDMLINGISSSQVNLLLANIIDYIKEISSTGNNAVKSQYAELFGVTMSDMAAFNNLSDTVINELYASAMTYSDTLDELNDQLSQVGSRMHLSEMIDNVYDNIMASTGMSIANNTGLYATYKAFDMLEDLTGGINLPYISVFGSGMDLNMSLEGIAKSAIIGIGTATSLINGISNALSGGMLDYTRWTTGELDKSSGYSSYTSSQSLSTSKSSVSYVSSSNSTGIQQSLYDTQEEAGTTVTGNEEEEENEMITLTRAILEFLQAGGDESNPMYVRLANVYSTSTSYSNLTT